MRSQSGGPGQPFDCLGRRGVKYGAGEEGRGAGRREREGGRDGGMKEGWRSQSILADGFHCPPHCSVSFQPHPFREPYSRTHPVIYCRYGTHTHALRAGQPLSLFGHEGSCVASRNLKEELSCMVVFKADLCNTETLSCTRFPSPNVCYKGRVCEHHRV